ncbi:hypothetical protein D4764_20G0008380 [Takifugu flavidus]|uniref:Uncharacterized protein n=1 Tax=Takifugu flavidus TaxID=433684 RepID=A0A5C6NIA6_9TELE|nr:hypothetical protein D4764_20G0008380 [Takifugu flavidus]
MDGDSEPPPFTPRSTWTPSVDTLPPEVQTLITADKQYFDHKFRPCRVMPNLSHEEATALQELRQNINIIIKPADKGSTVKPEDPMPTFLREVEVYLIRIIQPFCPSEETHLWAHQNAKDWTLATIQTLKEHYLRVQEEAKHHRHPDETNYRRLIPKGMNSVAIPGTPRLRPFTRREPHTGEQIDLGDKRDREEEEEGQNTDDPNPRPAKAAFTKGPPYLPLHTEHPHRGETNLSWSLLPQRQVLLIGDSNLARFPEIWDPRIQVDSFPGAKISHAVSLLRKGTPPSPEVTKVVLSFGLDDLNSTNPSLYVEDAYVVLEGLLTSQELRQRMSAIVDETDVPEHCRIAFSTDQEEQVHKQVAQHSRR